MDRPRRPDHINPYDLNSVVKLRQKHEPSHTPVRNPFDLSRQSSAPRPVNPEPKPPSK
jgi:hypothetical protein